MAQVTRRFFLLSSAAFSAGCATRQPAAMDTPTPSIRQPAVDQSWRYAKHDLFTRGLVEIQVDRVAAINGRVEIESMAEATKDTKAVKPRWGAEFLGKYVVRHDTPGGDLPSEIQEPWGMVLVDPHWAQVQVYERPIPLWPEQLRPGWETQISTKYKTPIDQEALPWDQEMKALAWETITVPAGRFKTLRFNNLIKFRNGDIGRTDSVRQETVWLAPEVGRWVARESRGTYYVQDSVIAQPYNESGFRWELLQWS
jgi:hypothetical protein